MQYTSRRNIFSIKAGHHHANLEFTATLWPNTIYTKSKSFSPSQGNAIALHYPTNMHHIVHINYIQYTAPSHNPCIINISNAMLMLILMKINYFIQAQISHTAHSISKEITNNAYNVERTRLSTMDFQDARKCWWRGRNSFHAIHLKEKHIQHQNSTPSCQS